MGSAGFINYSTEWWHWSYGDRYWALITKADSAIYGPSLTTSNQRDLSRQSSAPLGIIQERSGTFDNVAGHALLPRPLPGREQGHWRRSWQSAGDCYHKAAAAGIALNAGRNGKLQENTRDRMADPGVKVSDNPTQNRGLSILVTLHYVQRG
jgi:hypothetical protein